MLPRSVKRRTFLATAAAVGFPYLVPSGVLAAGQRKGANERILIGHIGMGGRAKGLWKELAPLREAGQCQSVALCDVDDKRLQEASKLVGPHADVYRDYRELLRARISTR